MHIKKNVCDNLVGALLNIEEKIKDTTNVWLNVQDLKIRKDLHLIELITYWWSHIRVARWLAASKLRFAST